MRRRTSQFLESGIIKDAARTGLRFIDLKQKNIAVLGGIDNGGLPRSLILRMRSTDMMLTDRDKPNHSLLHVHVCVHCGSAFRRGVRRQSDHLRHLPPFAPLDIFC